MPLPIRRTGLRLLICLLAGLAGLPAAAVQAAPKPPTPPPTAIERLARLAKLWGTVRYFHPYLAYKDLDWDAAAVAAIPKVRAAKSVEEYRAAVSGMLATLGDPATFVEPMATSPAPAPAKPAPAAPGTASATVRPPFFHWAEDGLLVLDFRPYNGYAIYSELPAALGPAVAELAKARAVVFDLRGQPVEGESGVDYSPALEDLASLLVDRPLRAPSRRYLLHSGYRGQGVSSGSYYSAFVTPSATLYTPASPQTPQTPQKPPQRIVFLVSRRTVLPEIALALQAGGQGSLVSENPLDPDAYIATSAVDLGEGLTARVRTSETLPLPGWPGVHADAEVTEVAEGAEVPAGAGPPGSSDPALEAALALARKPAAAAEAKSGAAPVAGSPLPEAVFRPDRSYREMRAPELPYRMLAVFRYWNVIQYFYPYKALIGDWSAVLPEALARMETAEGERGYAEAVLEMSTHVPDGHTNVWGHPAFAQIRGESQVPIVLRFLAGSYVVTAADDAAKKAGIEIGDVLVAIDGQPVATRVAYLKRFVTAATEAALRDRIGAQLTGGKAGSTKVLSLQGASGALREVRFELPAAGSFFFPKKEGPVVQILPGNLGYVDLTRLETSEVDGMFEKVANTRGLIFDMRGYPRGTAWSIAPRLGKEGEAPGTKIGARFRRAEVSALADGDNETTSFAFEQAMPTSTRPKYTKPTVMLIDDRAISQSEHSGLFYEAANGTKFIGSPSAGANGDVTRFVLPGGIAVLFTGHDVRHADGRQLQRVGLQPDIPVEPTIAGIRSGKDEVLERAERYLIETTPK
jgi:C-terminal processing protease CtpA/Prc